VDAVEIDPVVTRMAREHFGLADEEAAVYHMDGRGFLATTGETFDLVIMDAFGSSSIPFHLVTRESFALIHSRLAPNGILAMNVEATAWHDIFVHSLAVTMLEVFGHVVALPMAEPPNTLGNLVLLASDRPLELEYDPPVPRDRFSPEYNRAHAWDNRFESLPGAFLFSRRPQSRRHLGGAIERRGAPDAPRAIRSASELVAATVVAGHRPDDTALFDRDRVPAELFRNAAHEIIGHLYHIDLDARRSVVELPDGNGGHSLHRHELACVSLHHRLDILRRHLTPVAGTAAARAEENERKQRGGTNCMRTQARHSRSCGTMAD